MDIVMGHSHRIFDLYLGFFNELDILSLVSLIRGEVGVFDVVCLIV